MPAASWSDSEDERRPRKVVVIGDVMLDRYLSGQVRLSSEGAVIGVNGRPPEVEERLGGAGNVAVAAAALGCEVALVGVVGDDAEGQAISNLAMGWGMNTHGLLIDPERPSTLKTRISSRGRRLLRVDRESKAQLSSCLAAQLHKQVEAALITADAVIFSDYDKGVFRRLDPATIITAARQRGALTLADPKPANVPRFGGVHWLTPNLDEARLASGIHDPEAEPLGLALALRGGQPGLCVAVTLGAEGLVAVGAGGLIARLKATTERAVDETGAGDTFIAALATALAEGQPPASALTFANTAAGLVVREPGTTWVHRHALTQALMGEHDIIEEAPPCGA